MNQEQQEKVRQLVEVLDHALATAGCGVLDALNAVSVMSTTFPTTRELVSDEICATAESIADLSRPLITTSKPCRANSSLMALPIPLAPPVMNTTGLLTCGLTEL
mgnify:CR=1 FL=1